MSGRNPFAGDPTLQAIARYLHDLARDTVTTAIAPFTRGGRLDLSNPQASNGTLPPSRGGSGNTVGLRDHDHSGAAINAQKLKQVNTHELADTDSATTALHHTLGISALQAAAGNHAHTTVPPHAATHETSAGGDYLDPSIYQIPASTAHKADSLAGLLDQLYTTDVLTTHGYGLGGYGTEPYGSPDTKLDNPMTTAGDLIVGTAGGAPGRLGVGAAGQVLTVSGGTPAWAAASGGGHTIQDEGLALTQRPALNVVGEHATAADDAPNNRTNLTVAVPDVTTALHGLMLPGDKSKLDGVAAGAQVNVLEGITGTAPIVADAITAKSQALSISPATSAAAGSMSAADKSKLDGLAGQVIATQTLAADAASITFSNIPQTFRHLLLLGKLRSTIAGAADDGFIRLNGDTTANYDSAYLYINGSTVVGGTMVASANGIYLGAIPGGTNAANNASAMEMTLPDYAGTAWRKSGHARVADQSETRQVCLISDGSWRNTAAITSLTIYAAGGNLAANSTVTLYGLY